MTNHDVEAALEDLTHRRLKLMGVEKDRRARSRTQFNIPVPARFGRVEGQLVDIAPRGARLRHSQPLNPGAESRLIFDWGSSWFNAVTKVLSTRFVDSGEEKRVYESRLQFVEVPPQSQQTLEQVVATLRNAQLRKWVGNLMGEALAGALPNDENAPRTLLRYRFVDGRWIVRLAGEDEQQPPDGFMLPSSVGDAERKSVCAAYCSLDKDGRQLLRLFASAALAA